MGAGDTVLTTGQSSKHRWGKLDIEPATESELLLGPADAGGHGSTDGTIWSSVFNLCNSAIGAGILALPYAVKESGLILGMILVVCMCLTLAYTLKILVWSNRLYPGAKSYEKLVWAVFGKKASILVTFSVILTTFGACTGFLIIIADILPPLVKLVFSETEWVYSRIFVTIVVSVIGILPLSSFKQFNSLRFSSTLAIISVSFTVFVIIFRSSQILPLSPENRENIHLFNLGLGIFSALPLIAFAFGCHMQIIPIFAELKDNHIPSRPNWVIISTNLVCLVLYSLTGCFGYLQFPLSEQGNVLKNYGDDDALVNVARAVLCLVIVCHYPPSNYCCRAALDYLFLPNAKENTYRRLGWTYGIWALSLVVSIAIPDIDVVFGLIGATANSLIVFIFPALFLLGCNSRYNWEGLSGTMANALGAIILIVGIVISGFGTVTIILSKWFKGVL